MVVFYSNDMKSTPYDMICDNIDEKSTEAVHGLELIERWNGDENVGQGSNILLSYYHTKCLWMVLTGLTR